MKAIELEVFSYGTEDIDKVKKAVSLFVPAKKLKIKTVEGFQKTIINILKYKARRSKEVDEIYNKIKNLITDKVMEERFDKKEKILYLRFDKQLAYKKKLKLIKQGDGVLIKFYL